MLHLFPQLLERLAGYRNIPPHHPAATTPEEAYVLPEVFPGVWGSVNSGQLLGASEDAAAAQQLKERHQVRPPCAVSAIVPVCVPLG